MLIANVSGVGQDCVWKKNVRAEVKAALSYHNVFLNIM